MTASKDTMGELFSQIMTGQQKSSHFLPNPSQKSSQHASEQGIALPPVQQWNPPFCGDIDMVIRRDGSWHYMNSPIGRERMVQLFATVLRRDGEQYFLVTPVEKVGITVEDVPFVATTVTTVEHNGQSALAFTTSVGDMVIAGEEHPLRVELDPATAEPAPYIHIRDRLEARIHRNVFYEMIEMAEVRSVDGCDWYGVESDGKFFTIAPVD